MENIILIAVLVAIIGLAVFYVIRAKKKGKKCIGCPEGVCTCSTKEDGCGSCCGCHSQK